MRSAGEALAAAGVRAIYLVHGTFAGTDALGLIRAATRFVPNLRQTLEQQGKQLADAVFGETGNYTPAYAALLQESLATASASANPPILVRLFCWSSENHHVGRAHAAVALIDELNRLAENEEKPGRILVWGHSHGGNVLALATNLLAADAETLERFFTAGRPYYRVPLVGRIDAPLWPQVHELLGRGERPLDRWKIDVATFGTPIRYGWDTHGVANLLHFVNHRPAESVPEYRVPFPPKLGAVVHATHGDYFQQFGIAGTNLAPPILETRTWNADRRLARVVQPGIPRRGLVRYISHGMRVHGDGTTLLVDYQDQDQGLARHLAGHGVYTRAEWMLLHVTEICQRFYGWHPDGA